MEGGYVVHRKFVNAMQHTAEEEQKGAPDNRVTRWVMNSLERQRPDFREESASSLEDLGEQDATWLREAVNGAQGRFIETSAPQAIVPAQDDNQMPAYDAADAL